MNILSVSDSFKGCLTSEQVNNIVKEVFGNEPLNASVHCLNMSDGGEGFLDTFAQIGGYDEKIVTVCNPVMRSISARYLVKDNVAIVELAQAAGLTLLEPEVRNPMFTTTYGVGQIIRHAIEVSHCTDILLGIGGSATNDAGLGLVQALGLELYHEDERIENGICGEQLSLVTRFDDTILKQVIKGVTFSVACDVDNPLYGTNGAAYVYARQKGASDEDIVVLDGNLRNIGNLFTNNIVNSCGAGAAGGVGAGMLQFLNAKLDSGIDLVFRALDFSKKYSFVDLVVTGEGRIDEQSFMGKLLNGVLSHTEKLNIPILAIAGQVKLEKDNIPSRLEVLQVTPDGMILEEAMKYEKVKENIKRALNEYVTRGMYIKHTAIISR